MRGFVTTARSISSGGDTERHKYGIVAIGQRVQSGNSMLEGGALIIMHGRSRMTINSRIPKMPGRSTSGFHRPGRHSLHHTRSARRCWTSSMKDELHPTKNRFWGGFSCIWMTASMNDSIYGVATSRDSNEFLCNCLVGALPDTHYVHPPCAELRFSPHKNDPTRLPAVVTAKNKTKKRYPGCLAHVVRGVIGGGGDYRRHSGPVSWSD